MPLARSIALVPVLLGLAAPPTSARAAPVLQDTDVVIAGRPGPQDAGYLGVRVADVDSAAVSRLDLSELRGARVVSVADSSPAAEAGLRTDDVIASLDGEAVRSVAQLSRMVRETPPGRSVRLQVVRGGSTRQVTVVTGRRPGGMGAAFSPDMRIRMRKILDDSTRARIREEMDRAREEMRRSGDELRRSWRSGEVGPHAFVFELGGPGRLGVRLQPMSDQLGAYFGVEDGHGALVGRVESGSAAEKAGLKAGDVIVAVAGRAVEDPGDVVSAIHDAEAGPLKVEVMRDRKEKTLTVDLPERRRAAPGAGATSLRAPRPGARGLPPVPDVRAPLPAPPALESRPPLAPLPPAPAALPRVDRII